MVSEAIATRWLVGAVCHGPAGLIDATTTDGKSLLAGRKVNCFTNAEERAAGMSDIVPFQLEDQLRQLGGKFASGAVFQQFVVEDGGLITRQNPAAAEAVAKRMGCWYCSKGAPDLEQELPSCLKKGRFAAQSRRRRYDKPTAGPRPGF